MTIIDGKTTAATIRAEIKNSVEELKAAGGRAPHLVAVIVGHDGGSEAYVASKARACSEVGVESTVLRFDEDITEEELLREVQRLNDDDGVDGFIDQLPLPRHIDANRVIEAIDPSKDVDGFHPVNVGKMAIGLPCFVSATPAGIVELLRRYGIKTRG